MNDKEGSEGLGALARAWPCETTPRRLAPGGDQLFGAGPFEDGVEPAGATPFAVTPVPNVTLLPFVAILMLGAPAETALTVVDTSTGVAWGPVPCPRPAVPIERSGVAASPAVAVFVTGATLLVAPAGEPLPGLLLGAV